MDNLPPALENLKPYLVRASELSSRHPVVAYYCTNSKEYSLVEVLFRVVMFTRCFQEV